MLWSQTELQAPSQLSERRTRRGWMDLARSGSASVAASAPSSSRKAGAGFNGSSIARFELNVVAVRRLSGEASTICPEELAALLQVGGCRILDTGRLRRPFPGAQTVGLEKLRKRNAEALRKLRAV